MNQEITDENARTMRTHWFTFLDTVEPIRAPLYSYCRDLTDNVWDAEDLVQETLLKGFAMTARGDFHGPESPVTNVKAYLFRTATNCWLDTRRKLAREQLTSDLPETTAQIDDIATLEDAIGAAFRLTSEREFAAFLLKDGYSFSLSEIADFIGTTTGTVKSALNRARTKMTSSTHNTTNNSNNSTNPNKQLAGAFADAINSQDVDRVIALMADTLQISVCNVGGGRGNNGVWTESAVRGVRAEWREFDGEPVVLMIRNNALYDVLRLEGSEGQVTRLIDYCFAPDTLQTVAQAFGMPCSATKYHQPAESLPDMIATTTLPWRS